MAHALNNASHTSACAELGISVGTNRNQTTLTRHATMNKWSFYRSGSIAANVTTKLMELTAPSNNDKLGDFRGYVHNAIVPTIPADYDRYYGPGGSSFTITFAIFTEQWNLRETSSGSIPYIIIKYYPTASDRTNGTNLIRTLSTLVSETGVTPPVGHTNDQTAKQASASQIIIDTFDVIDVPGGGILYCDVYIGNNGGSTVYGRFGAVVGDSHVDISIFENQNPEIIVSGTVSGMPSGYTVGFLVISASSWRCNDDSPMAGGSIGSPDIDFYIGVHGIFSSSTRSMLCTSVVFRIAYDGSTKDVSLGNISNTIKRDAADTLPGGKTWVYNKDATITWVSGTVSTTYTSC